MRWTASVRSWLFFVYTKSDIEIVGSISSVSNDHIPLPGLSENVWNATLYYEKHGFGARIATRYRSKVFKQLAALVRTLCARTIVGYVSWTLT